MIENMDSLNIFKDAGSVKIVWINNSIWITNFIKIIDYAGELIKFKIKNNILVVEGINLKIEMLDKNEIVVSGEIQKVYLEGKSKKGEGK